MRATCTNLRRQLSSLLVLLACVVFGSAQQLPTITKAAQIRAESAEESNKHYPVRLRAVVTFYDDHVFNRPATPDLFVQDASSGIWVDAVDLVAAGQLPTPHVGDLLEVVGQTETIDFAPQVRARSIRLLGQAPLPNASKLPIDELESGAFDSQWVEIKGVAHRALAGLPGLQFDLYSGTRRLRVQIELEGAERERAAAVLPDAEVRIRGVCATDFNAHGQRFRVHLIVPSLAQVVVLRPAANPFAGPVTPIRGLLQYSPHLSAWQHRTHVRGVVTLVNADGSFDLQDGSGGVYVTSPATYLGSAGVKVRVGELVDVAAFAFTGNFKPMLTDGEVRSSGVQQPITPILVDAQQLVSGTFDAELVRVRGRLAQHYFEPQLHTEVLELQVGKELVSAWVDSGPATFGKKLDSADNVEITGVCSIRADDNGVARGFRVLMRNPDDVRVLSTNYVRRPYKLLSAVLGLALLLAGACAFGLLQQVRAHKAVILVRDSQLRQAQKMEAVGRLAGGIAHDFNNLLTVINGQCGLLLARDLPPGHGARNRALTIQQATDRAARLVRQLLAFGRQQIMTQRVLRPGPLVLGLAGMLRSLVGEDVELGLSVQRSSRLIKADPGQLEQVLVNLAMNARDAMEPGGKLLIDVVDLDLESPIICVDAVAEPGRYVMIAVTDTGKGITPEVQARIFEPFFTTKPQDKGTGLGLPMVYGIVKQSNGHIDVHSSPDKGTTFRIYLPETHEQEEPAAPPAQTSDNTGAPNLSILVVEDEEDVRQLIHEGLQQYGYAVLCAESGAQALGILNRLSRPLDLLLTDVVMPGMSGRQLASQVAAIQPRAKVLYMSGYSEQGVLEPEVLRDDRQFIQKPFTIEQLAGTVKAVLETRAAATGAAV